MPEGTAAQSKRSPTVCRRPDGALTPVPRSPSNPWAGTTRAGAPPPAAGTDEGEAPEMAGALAAAAIAPQKPAGAKSPPHLPAEGKTGHGVGRAGPAGKRKA